MKLWQRASGAIKDRNSLWKASLAKRSKFYNPDLEATVIKATSHDDRFVDYTNTQHVFATVRAAPSSSLLPFICALTRRLERTHCWAVAVKGLMLFHGVLCTKLPGTRKIGRLPFDLSLFEDAYHSPRSHRRDFNSFVRAYFHFLDYKSGSLIISTSGAAANGLERIAVAGAGRRKIGELEEESQSSTLRSSTPTPKATISGRLRRLEEWQEMLDLLLEVRPRGRGVKEVVLLEAMDCVIIEVFDVYSKICDGIANVLIRIYAATSGAAMPEAEAGSALKVLQKARRQGEELEDYFVLCREIGLLNAAECPKVERISDEDVRELEKIIDGSTGKKNEFDNEEKKEEELAVIMARDGAAVEEYVTMEEVGVVSGTVGTTAMTVRRTVITDKWEVFDDDHQEKVEMKAIGDLIDLTSDDYCFGDNNSYKMNRESYNYGSDINHQGKIGSAASMAIMPVMYNYSAEYHGKFEGCGGGTNVVVTT